VARAKHCLPPFQVSSWSIQPFGHNRHGPKLEGCCAPFWREGVGGAGSHLTQCGLVEAYIRTKWYLHPSSLLATIDMGRGLYGCRQSLCPQISKLQGLLCPFHGGSWVPIKHNVAGKDVVSRPWSWSHGASTSRGHEQEGQHPLTGQHAPPISGGT